MSPPAYPTRNYRKCLKRLGLIHKRSNGGHEVWDFPEGHTISLLRPLTFQSHHKSVPHFIVGTNASNLYLSPKVFISFCKDKKASNPLYKIVEDSILKAKSAGHTGKFLLQNKVKFEIKIDGVGRDK